jgi:hypothetical protein
MVTVFVLSFDDYNRIALNGVFSDVEKAKNHAEALIGGQRLNWANPHTDGTVWADGAGGTFVIRATQFDPEKS